jgi:uncharacterized protein (DUF433 family)
MVRTGIPVWVLVQARILGMSEADILKSYPTLRAEDLATARGYNRAHRAEIHAEINKHEIAWSSWPACTQAELRALKADIAKGYATMKADAAGAVDQLRGKIQLRTKDFKENVAGFHGGKGLQD